MSTGLTPALQAKRDNINKQLLAEKIALWDKYTDAENTTVTVKKAKPTVFNQESKIDSLRTEFRTACQLAGITLSSDTDVYRDESPEFEELRKKYIDVMNNKILIQGTWYNQITHDITLTDQEKLDAHEYVHAIADKYRDRIRAVGGVPYENTLDEGGTGQTDNGQYWINTNEKYKYDKPAITLDEMNNPPTQVGRALYKYYKSFAGTDAIAQLVFPGQKHIVLGEVSTLSYSIFRKTNPINTLGRISVKGFTKGFRMVAGTMIFTVTNTHWTNDVMEAFPDLFTGVKKIKADELPLFDIVITYANEYGANSYYVIYGVKIGEEGQVVSIEDAFSENVCQFVARDIDVNRPNVQGEVQGRAALNPKDYDALPVFDVDNLIMDDAYQAAQSAKNKLIDSLAAPAAPKAPTSTLAVDVKGATSSPSTPVDNSPKITYTVNFKDKATGKAITQAVTYNVVCSWKYDDGKANTYKWKDEKVGGTTTTGVAKVQFTSNPFPGKDKKYIKGDVTVEWSVSGKSGKYTSNIKDITPSTKTQTDTVYLGTAEVPITYTASFKYSSDNSIITMEIEAVMDMRFKHPSNQYITKTVSVTSSTKTGAVDFHMNANQFSDVGIKYITATPTIKWRFKGETNWKTKTMSDISGFDTTDWFNATVLYSAIMNIDRIHDGLKDPQGNHYIMNAESIDNHWSCDQLAVKVTNSAGEPLKNKWVKWTPYVHNVGADWTTHYDTHIYKLSELKAAKNRYDHIYDDYAFYSLTDSNGYTNVSRAVAYVPVTMTAMDEICKRYINKECTDYMYGFLYMMGDYGMNIGIDYYSGKSESSWNATKGFDWAFNLTAVVVDKPSGKAETNKVEYSYIQIGGDDCNWAIDYSK